MAMRVLVTVLMEANQAGTQRGGTEDPNLGRDKEEVPAAEEDAGLRGPSEEKGRALVGAERVRKGGGNGGAVSEGRESSEEGGSNLEKEEAGFFMRGLARRGGRDREGSGELETQEGGLDGPEKLQGEGVALLLKPDEVGKVGGQEAGPNKRGQVGGKAAGQSVKVKGGIEAVANQGGTTPGVGLVRKFDQFLELVRRIVRVLVRGVPGVDS